MDGVLARHPLGFLAASYTEAVHLNRRRLTRVVPTVVSILGTVVGLGFVLVSSERRAPRNQSGEAVPGLLQNLGAAAAVVYIAFAIYVVLVARFRGQRRRPDRPASQPVAGLIRFVMVVAFLIFLATKFHRFGFNKLPALFRPQLESQLTPVAPKIRVEKPITWGYSLGFVLVAVMVVLAVVIAVRNRRSRVVPPVQADRRALVAVSLDDLLAELDNEIDPRRAVLLADHGMELALAEHGLPRATTETAPEHVQRVATELSLSNTAARTLTMLYGHAHFSPDEMTQIDRQSAIAALQSVRDELRSKLPITQEDR